MYNMFRLGFCLIKKKKKKMLVYLTETWNKLMEKGKFVGVLFIDFRKAFDTVDHTIMGQKLRQAGFSGNIALTIQNYLNNRFQLTEIDKSISVLRKIECGAPQSSLLGPRLFLMQVDDFPEALSKGQLEMYADDTTIYCAGSTMNEICEGLQIMLRDIHQWCANNRLTIHPEKSKAMILNRHKYIGPLN